MSRLTIHLTYSWISFDHQAIHRMSGQHNVCVWVIPCVLLVTLIMQLCDHLFVADLSLADCYQTSKIAKSVNVEITAVVSSFHSSAGDMKIRQRNQLASYPTGFWRQVGLGWIDECMDGWTIYEQGISSHNGCVQKQQLEVESSNQKHCLDGWILFLQQ